MATTSSTGSTGTSRLRFPLGRSLPAVSETNSTNTPARGREMSESIQRMTGNRPLSHVWTFWVEKPSAPSQHSANSPAHHAGGAQGAAAAADSQSYTPELTQMCDISSIPTFWYLMNNVDFTKLPTRYSAHLFHKTVRPVWEDPRNARGGAWTFRLPKNQAPEFWQHVYLLAVGNQLQAAVETKRTTFNDDICGISFRPRFASSVVTIWNRDGEHEGGIKRILETVLSGLPEHLQLREGSYYYKKHSDNEGFDATRQAVAPTIKAPQPRAAPQGGQTVPRIVSIPIGESEDDNPPPTAAQEKDMEQEMAKMRMLSEDMKTMDEEAEAQGDAPA